MSFTSWEYCHMNHRAAIKTAFWIVSIHQQWKQQSFSSTVNVMLALTTDRMDILHTNLVNWYLTSEWLFGCSRLADFSPCVSSIALQSTLPALYASAQLLFASSLLWLFGQTGWQPSSSQLQQKGLKIPSNWELLQPSRLPSLLWREREMQCCNIMSSMCHIYLFIWPLAECHILRWALNASQWQPQH